MPDTPMYDYGYYSPGSGQFGGALQNPQYGPYGGQSRYGYNPQGQSQYGSPQGYYQSPQYQQNQQNYNTQNQGVYDQWVKYNQQQAPSWQAPEYDPNRNYRSTGAASGFNPSPVVDNQWWGATPAGSGSYGGYGQQSYNPVYPQNGNVKSANTYAQTPVSNFNFNDWMRQLTQAYQGGGGEMPAAPEYNKWTPPEAFQQDPYQAPGAWNPGSVDTPGVIDTQALIDSFQPQIQEGMDKSMAAAGARFGQAGALQSGGGGTGYADALGEVGRKAGNDLANLQYQYKYGAAEQAAARQQQAQQAALDRSLSSWGQQGNWQYGGDMADRSNAYDQWRTMAGMNQDAWSQGNQWNQNQYGLNLGAQQQGFDQNQQRYQQLLQLMQMGHSWL